MNKKALGTISLALALSLSVGCGGGGSSISTSIPEEEVVLDITPVVRDGYLP